MKSFEHEYILKTIISTYRLLDLDDLRFIINNTLLKRICLNTYPFSQQKFSINTTHKKLIYSILCLNDGKLVTNGSEKRLLVWKNINSAFVLDRSLEHDNRLKDFLKLLQNGNIISADFEGNIYIWNKDNYELVHKLNGHHSIWSILELPNGHLITSTLRHSVKVLDSNNNYEHIDSLFGHTSFVDFFLPMKDSFFVAASSDTIRLWRYIYLDSKYSYTCVQTVKHEANIMGALILDETSLLSYCLQSTIIWKFEENYEGDEIVSLTGMSKGFNYILLLEDGNLAGFEDNTIYIKDKNNNYRDFQILNSHKQRLSKITISYSRLLSGDIRGTINIWSKHNNLYRCIQTLNMNCVVWDLIILDKNKLVCRRKDQIIVFEL
jgi:hypothetical protein